MANQEVMGPQTGEEGKVKISVLRLNGSKNYNNWAWATKQALKGKGAWGVVTSDVNELGYTAVPAADAAMSVKLQYSKCDGLALDVIASTIPEKYLSYITQATDARDAWKALKKTFGYTSPAALRALKANLNSLKADETKPLDVFFDAVHEAVSLIRNVEAVDDEDPKFVILSGVPEIFKPYVSGVEGAQLANATPMPLGVIIEGLLAEEARLLKAGDLTYGTSGASKQGEKAMKTFVQKQKGAGGKREARPRVECFFCKSLGHRREECEKYLNAQVLAMSNKVAALAAPSSFYNNGSTSSQLKFLLDSGASIHMVGGADTSIFRTFQQLNNGPKIEVANGQFIQATGVGSIRFSWIRDAEVS